MEYQARQLARGLSANCFLVDILEEYCNEPSDFCMTCADYRAASGFDRVIYYGPQYWGISAPRRWC